MGDAPWVYVDGGSLHGGGGGGGARGGEGGQGEQPSMHGPPLTIRGTDSPQSGLSIMSGGRTDVGRWHRGWEGGRGCVRVVDGRRLHTAHVHIQFILHTLNYMYKSY